MLKATVTPPSNLKLVIRDLKTADSNLMQAAEKALARGLQFALSIATKQYLSGPRPNRLDVVTARLRNSLVTRVTREPNRIVGILGTNVKYAAYHEYGFRGIQKVAGHYRGIRVVKKGKTIAGKDAAKDQRRHIRDATGTRLAWKDSLADVAARTGATLEKRYIHPHDRKLNYWGKPFLKPAMVDALPTIKSQLIAALKSALKGGK
jgi:phage gpG-like protein